MSKGFPDYRRHISIDLAGCQTVYCFVDPCAFAKCEKHPQAVCRYVYGDFFCFVLAKNTRLPESCFFLVRIIVVVAMLGFTSVMNVWIAIKKIFVLIFTQQMIIKEQK